MLKYLEIRVVEMQCVGLSGTLQGCFKETSASSSQVLLSVPNTTSDHTRGRLCELMFGELQIASVAICGQAILALYAYGLTTGVVVDLGHRMEILPVTDGKLLTVLEETQMTPCPVHDPLTSRRRGAEGWGGSTTVWRRTHRRRSQLASLGARLSIFLGSGALVDAVRAATGELQSSCFL